MKILKNIALILLTLVIIVSPFLSVVLYATLSEPVYDKTYNAALIDKIDRLKSVDGRKIVVIGGSSVAFGLDSELMERYTGLPVVNFGLYASLGSNLMLDLAQEYINEDDIVIFAPEMDSQALSMYFSANNTLQSADGNLDILRGIDSEHYASLFGGMWDFARGKIKAGRNGIKLGTLGIYRRDSFNSYCDIDVPRPQNVMNGYYDTNNLPMLRESDYGSELDEFSQYLSEYCSRLPSGAKMYFSFSPMNELSISDTLSHDDISDFGEYISGRLGLTSISYIEDYILDAGYFYDTNFHLNDAGVKLRTIRLSRDLRLELGITDGVLDDEPEAPELPFFDVTFDGEEENAKYFTYTTLSDGSKAIIGLSKLGMTMEHLTVPLGVDGRKIISIERGGLASENLRSLTITEDSNLTRFAEGAFEGAGNLTDIYIYKKSGNDINPPSSFAGASRSLRVHVPYDSDFISHYYWSERGLTFVVMN